MTTEQLDGRRAVAPLRPGDRVVIIGAGPGGLTAAYLLAKQHVAVTVFEADDVVGGLARTAQYKGYRFPAEIIRHCVWPYFRFSLSYRDVEDLMASAGSY